MVARIALCLEQTLGHRSHSLNLEHALERRALAADVVRVDYTGPGIPPIPWALRGSHRARLGLRRVSGRAELDVVFYHTQTVSLFAPWTMEHPYVVSVDATPIQMDTMGSWYRHRTRARAIERGKAAWYRRVFGEAAQVVAWSQWAADSLGQDYAVDPAKVIVVHPGAPEDLFTIPRLAPARKPRILFVGGDLARKGGDVLIDAYEAVRDRAELIVVTESPLQAGDGIDVRHGVRPGTPEFVDAFAAADLFCLPTRGDCTPVAIGEALAAGLPTVTTRIGSNAETVRDGETGILVDVDSVVQLREALGRLVDDAALRHTMAQRAREDARERFMAAANADRVLDVVMAVGT